MMRFDTCHLEKNQHPFIPCPVISCKCRCGVGAGSPSSSLSQPLARSASGFHSDEACPSTGLSGPLGPQIDLPHRRLPPPAAPTTLSWPSCPSDHPMSPIRGLAPGTPYCPALPTAEWAMAHSGNLEREGGEQDAATWLSET